MSGRSPRLLRLFNAPRLEQRLRAQVWERLERRRARWRNYHLRWERRLRRGVADLGVSDRVRFEVLHRQFDGGGAPGLPTLVRAARLMVKGWRQLSTRARARVGK